jgi:hypothetical protein
MNENVGSCRTRETAPDFERNWQHTAQVFDSLGGRCWRTEVGLAARDEIPHARHCDCSAKSYRVEE